MRFWDIESGDLLREFADTAGPHRVLRDGRHIAYADKDKLLIYDPVANRAVSAPSSHSGEDVVRIAVSDDGTQLATLTYPGTLTLWHVLISATDRSFVLSRVASASTRTEMNEARAVEFSASGDSVWTASNTMLMRWAASGNPAGTALAGVETVRTGAVQGERLRRIPRSDLLVLPGNHAQRGSYLIFYDSARKAAALLEVERNYYPSVAFNGDGSLLFTGIANHLRRRDPPSAGDFSAAENVLAALLPPSPAAASAQGPILKALPSNLAIEVIGVYEGGGPRTQSIQTSSGPRGARSVTVSIGRTDQPLALVLASYEPVIWEINLGKNARLAQVMVSGYYDGLVRGAGSAQVTRIGPAYTYTFGDNGFAQLQEQVKLYTGKAVSGFQGSYRGIRFSVGTDAPKEVASGRPTMGLAPGIAETSAGPSAETISRWTSDVATGAGFVRTFPSQAVAPEVSAFAKALYRVSAYTSEEAALGRLVDAELDLVASRWLAGKLAASGRAPAAAPAGWDAMIGKLREPLAPIAKSHLRERMRALQASGLDGAKPFLSEYERLVTTEKSRGQLIFSSDPSAQEQPQTVDMPEILAFHDTRAAIKWRQLWPDLRAHAARLAALHYRVDADPSLDPSVDWNARANALARRIGGKVLSPAQWQTMAQGRLGFTLGGLDRFVLPLGTEMRTGGGHGDAMILREAGNSVVITQREGRGLSFRILDARWQRDIAGRLSAKEIEQIDDALTASWVESKGRWFAPLELEWDAHLAVSRQLRATMQMQQVYQSFAARSDAAMARVWQDWQ
jgi:hypothetical protein